jgi:hypothetical protein
VVDGLFLLPVGLLSFYWYIFPELRDYFGEIGTFVDGPATGQPPEPPFTTFAIFPIGYYVLIGGSLVVYQFLSYLLAGASPGKLLLSLIVVDGEGKSIKGDPLTALRRAAAEILTMLPVVGQLIGILNTILVLIEGNRSIFDRAANTRVVRRS